MKTGLKSGLAPLVILWLVAHAMVLALILGIKFVTAKVIILAMLLVAGVVFVWTQLRAMPRRLLGHAS